MGGLSLNTIVCALLCIEPAQKQVFAEKKTTNKLQLYGLSKSDINKNEEKKEVVVKMNGVHEKELEVLHCQSRIELDESNMTQRTIYFSLLTRFNTGKVMYMLLFNCLHFSTLWTYGGALVTEQNGCKADNVPYLISLAGISDILGNLFTGFLFDTAYVRRNQASFFYLLNILVGLTGTCLPLAKTFVSQCVVFFCWGFTAAGSCTLRNPLLARYVGHGHLLADSIGLTNVFLGAGHTLGPLISGKSSGGTGIYDVRH